MSISNNKPDFEPVLEGIYVELPKIEPSDDRMDIILEAFQENIAETATGGIENVSLANLSPEILQYIFKQIYDPKKSATENVCALNQLSVSHAFKANADDVLDQWLYTNLINLSHLRFNTPNEAVQFIIDHKLTSANPHELSFSEEDFQRLCDLCPQLKSLTILLTDIISEDRLVLALNKVPNLEILMLACGINTNGDALAEVLPTLERLKDLTLCHFTNPIGTKILEALPKLLHLESLDVSWNFNLPTHFIGKLIRLKKLNINHCNKPPSDQLVIELKKLKHLDSLSISGCTQISEVELLEIIRSHSMLQELDLSQNPQLSGKKIIEALKWLINLKSLELCCNRHITVDEFIEIAKVCPNLHTFNIALCHPFTKDQVVAVIKELPHVKKLSYHHKIIHFPDQDLIDQFPNIDFR